MNSGEHVCTVFADSCSCVDVTPGSVQRVVKPGFPRKHAIKDLVRSPVAAVVKKALPGLQSEETPKRQQAASHAILDPKMFYNGTEADDLSAMVNECCEQLPLLDGTATCLLSAQEYIRSRLAGKVRTLQSGFDSHTFLRQFGKGSECKLVVLLFGMGSPVKFQNKGPTLQIGDLLAVVENTGESQKKIWPVCIPDYQNGGSCTTKCLPRLAGVDALLADTVFVMDVVSFTLSTSKNLDLLKGLQDGFKLALKKKKGKTDDLTAIPWPRHADPFLEKAAAFGKRRRSGLALESPPFLGFDMMTYMDAFNPLTVWSASRWKQDVQTSKVLHEVTRELLGDEGGNLKTSKDVFKALANHSTKPTQIHLPASLEMKEVEDSNGWQKAKGTLLLFPATNS